MSVLIKGMEMSDTCENCNFHIYHGNGEYVCVATPMFYPMNLANSKGMRKDWCPLVEVPTPTIEERKSGRWNFIGDNLFECTCCLVVYSKQQLNGLRNDNSDPYVPRFCPNCGVKMEEGEQDG